MQCTETSTETSRMHHRHSRNKKQSQCDIGQPIEVLSHLQQCSFVILHDYFFCAPAIKKHTECKNIPKTIFIYLWSFYVTVVLFFWLESTIFFLNTHFLFQFSFPFKLLLMVMASKLLYFFPAEKKVFSFCLFHYLTFNRMWLTVILPTRV